MSGAPDSETMRAHGLSRRRVSRHTVDSWLLPPTSRAAREMPAGSLELLRLRLAVQASILAEADGA